jgi:medium-chain acyl-[acyl-carrier-protein] hydrolase
MRLVCFTNAGNEENIFTNEGLGARRVAVLLEWCRANSVELLAPQLPGRGARTKEPFLPDTQARARVAVLCVLRG